MLRTGTFLLLLIICFPAPAAAVETVTVMIYGLEGEALTNVEKTLALPYGMVQNGTVNVFWLERFSKEAPAAVRRALEPYGYYRAQVLSELKKIDNGNYRLIVRILPGTPVRVAAVKVEVTGPGSNEAGLQGLISSFPLRKGDVLDQTRYEEAKSRLRMQAIDLGYLDAAYSTHVIALDPDAASAVIDLVMNTGRQYRFDAVRFVGSHRYPIKFLNRYLTFSAGDVFSFARLGESQLNLLNSDRFAQVFPVPERDKTVDDRIPIVIHLEESPSKRLRPGIGYGTDVGPRFSLEYRDLNVFDRGHDFRSELNISDLLKNLGAEYRLPDAADIDSFTGMQINFKREDVSTYTNQNFSTELSRTRSFRRGRIGTLYIRLEKETSAIASHTFRSRMVLPGVRFSERRYDSLIRPTAGHHYAIDIRGTQQALGSDNRFFQVITEGNWLIPLPWRLSVLTRARVGATFQNAPASTLPLSYRMFAGGDRSVRGYSYQSLGPKNDAGVVTGGRDLIVASIELDRALLTNWGVAAFYDAGNAFNSFTGIRLHQGAGMGLRYYTVVGAIRLDLARQIAVPDPDYRVHFTVGFAF